MSVIRCPRCLAFNEERETCRGCGYPLEPEIGDAAFALGSRPAPAPADAVKILVEALTEVVGCFDAAQAEGLLEKVAGDEDLDEAGSLADLYNRRLAFAWPAAVAALSDPCVIAAQPAAPSLQRQEPGE